MIEIPAVRERCAAIDIGKAELAVALVLGPAVAHTNTWTVN